MRVVDWTLYLLISLLGVTISASEAQRAQVFDGLYSNQCAVCHGSDMLGTAQGGPLIGIELIEGDSVSDIEKVISEGRPNQGMPSWSETLSVSDIRTLAIFIAESRVGITQFSDFKVDELTLPDQPIHSSDESFTVEPVIQGLDRWPYSIAPLPDGRILLTEKTRGLSIISTDGKQSELVPGAPIGHAMGYARDQLQFGTGYIMDVDLHPNFEENGWIYIHFGHRCLDCPQTAVPESSPRPQAASNDAYLSRRDQPHSMNKVIRGRIRNGAWVDEETVWEVDRNFYTNNTEMAAGGRLAFDPAGYLFLSVGMKKGYSGIQDLNAPYGKIHRIHDDGRIPTDNPFVNTAGALPSIWTYGHRSPQGLEFDATNRDLWGTEMGPRGGDEVNLLLPGRNYGWPLFSKGLHYNGQPVGGNRQQLEITIDDIEQPRVDLTPGPAVSSFIIYSGQAFPNWQGNLLVGTLKGTKLFRMVFDNKTLIKREVILGPISRIRDIEVEPSGTILLLLEHRSNSQIVRLKSYQNSKNLL